MLQTQKELLNVLNQIGIEYTNHEHPAVYTVEEADHMVETGNFEIKIIEIP